MQDERIPSQEVSFMPIPLCRVYRVCVPVSHKSLGIAEVTEVLIKLNALSSLLICGQSDGMEGQGETEERR